VIGVVALVAAAIFGWSFYKEKQTDGRQQELAKIEEEYSAENKKAEDAKGVIRAEITKLETPEATPIDKAPKKAADPKVEAQKKDLEAKVAAIKADHSASLEKFKKFQATYPNVPEGWLAGMRAVSIYSENKNYQDAAALLKQVVDKAKDEPFYQIQGRLVLINLYEELKNYDGALKEVDVLSTLKDKSMEPQVLLIRGRILLGKNSKEEAAKSLDKLIADYAESPEAQKARGLKTLNF
jgi:predicted negative regulator of RcsB-dependent stress response